MVRSNTHNTFSRIGKAFFSGDKRDQAFAASILIPSFALLKTDPGAPVTVPSIDVNGVPS